MTLSACPQLSSVVEWQSLEIPSTSTVLQVCSFNSELPVQGSAWDLMVGLLHCILHGHGVLDAIREQG